MAYDTENGIRLHISIINAAIFSTVTGLTPPTTPVSPQTYLNLGLPWYKLFDEHIPHANNTPGALSRVKSIAAVSSLKAASGKRKTKDFQNCGYCSYQMPTIRLIPCKHVVCDDCANGLAPKACPSCDRTVRSRMRFAAAMVMPGEEDDDGVEAEAHDERIRVLKRYAADGRVVSFKHADQDVSGLSGR